jgi:hypothetical protein
MYYFVSVPNVTMTDGFGRRERSQFYKTGSSLEIVCLVSMQKFGGISLYLYFTKFCPHIISTYICVSSGSFRVSTLRGKFDVILF